MDGRTARVVMSLSEARAKADDLRRLLRDGKDPAVIKEAAKIAAANTFSLVADEWLAAQESLVTEDTHDKTIVARLARAIGPWQSADCRHHSSRVPHNFEAAACAGQLRHLAEAPGGPVEHIPASDVGRPRIERPR